MINLRFESRAMPVDTFHVLQFDGEEEVSKLYHFELRLVSRDPDIDFEAVLKSSAQLAITAQDNTRYLNGMLSEFEQRGQWQNGLYEYRAVLVPRLWIMAQSTQNQIFQELTVPAIIESELGSVSNKGSHPLVKDGLSVDDYEIYTIRDYDEREYVVQYKETDHNFISRLMEHEGIYYYFEQDDIREKLVVTDAMATEEIGDDSYATFQTEASASHYDSNVVYKLNRLQKQIPDSVLIKDFNYRSPSMPMQSDSLVDENGIGFVTEFGAHFKEPEQGEVLATLRTEEYRCRQNVYTGESNIAAMTCAGLYSLGQHFRSEYNQTYMLTRVRHSGSQEIESWGNVGATQYKNEFDCIPSEIPYRPERLTPKPRLYGIMNGTIDSELDTGRADIDELGRYKVMMPFDISGVGAGMGSRRIRMAQPYGGGGSGMSFPLVKGTEVIWTCIDGDIDRPIITGAVPNPLNPSVTTAENNTSNVIKTSSGITMSFQDGTGSGSQNNTGGGAGSGLAAQQQFQKQNQNQKTSRDPKSSIPDSISETTTKKTLPKQPIGLQQQMAGTTELNLNSAQTAAGNTYGVTEGKQYSVGVPDYNDTGLDLADGSKDSYLRLGKASNWEKAMGVEWTSKGDVDGTDLWLRETNLDGWFDYTDGDRVSVTQGKKIEYINGGDYDLVITDGDLETANAGHMHSSEFRKVGQWGEGALPVWRKTVLDHTCSDSYSFGDSESFFLGFTFDGFLGLATELNVGGSLSGSIAASVEGYAGSKVSFTAGPDINYSSGGVDSEGTTNEVTGELFAKINVKTPKTAVKNIPRLAGLASLAGIVTGALAGGSQHGETGSAVGAGLGMGVATSLTTAITAAALLDNTAKRAEIPLTELSLTPLGARLGIGVSPPLAGIDIGPGAITIGFGPTSQLVITPDGVKITSPKVDVITTTTIALKSPQIDATAAQAINLKSPSGNVMITANVVDSLGMSASNYK
jgi:type VI secretion system VgrG family protein